MSKKESKTIEEDILNVLICDDDILASSVLEEIIKFERKSFIVQVSSSEKLLEEIDNYEKKGIHFDILFMDVKIRNENTLSTMRDLTNEYEGIRVIACGGLVLTDEQLKLILQNGVKEFLPKPYRKEEVLPFVRK